MDIDLEKMATESRNSHTMNLDQMTSLEIVTAMNNEDATVSDAIKQHLKEIARVVDITSDAIKSGGRIIYMGAGTSGRLGILDASECPPTFGVSDELVIGLIAGGSKAIFKAQEGAEDSEDLGKQDLINHSLTNKDVVIGLAASGRTPYVIGGLKYANAIGAKTVAVACNTNSKIGEVANESVEIVVGPEVLTGSTRLKSGTAQKLVLNMISTATMARIGKVYENLMVDVQQTNEKLVARAERIVFQATGESTENVKKALSDANGNAKIAIVMLLSNLSVEEATLRLNKADGFVRKAIFK